MGTKKNKTLPKANVEIDSLKSEVAEFASSIGLSTSAAASGFNDADFRKAGTLKLQSQAPLVSSSSKKSNKGSTTNHHKENAKLQPKPKAGIQPLNTKNDIGAAALSNKAFSKYKDLPKLPLVKANALGVWYTDAAELEDKVVVGEEKKKVEVTNLDKWKALVQKKKELGERLLAQYVHDYESSRGQNGDIKMLIATQRSGTAADKVSAFSVMIGDNPVANIRSLDALLGMVTSKVGKRHSLTGFEVMKELFVSSLLPDRKLKTLFQRPLSVLPDSKDGNSLLLLWYFEDCLKQRYEKFISALEEGSRDVLAILKDKALKTIYALLKSKPEQERRLLSALVNKLGDPGKKAASNADFHLSKLLADHPSMKAVVIDEVDNFLFRPHLGMQAKFYAVNFLSQIRLSHQKDGPKIAKRIIDVYFALFKVLISEVNGAHKVDKDANRERETVPSSKNDEVKASSGSHVEMDSRLLTALLTGVNRAFPFVSSEESDEIIEAQTPILFKLVHSGSFNVGIQALMLLDKISSKNQIVSDRFYRALYSKLLLPSAINSSKEEMFFGLLLRAMKNDINLKRVAAFSKRLLQVGLQQPPQYACGCLFLVSEVLKARPPLWNVVLQSESIDDDIEHFEDVIEDDEREGMSEQDKTYKPVVGVDGDSLPCKDGCATESGGNALDNVDDVKPATDRHEVGSSNKSMLPGGYDPRHREPSYCNADRASWWELMVLASHVHPSVSTMAKTLLSGANIVYNGNPLNDLSLAAFLDKFMEKKPKLSTWHGASQIEPAKKLEMNHQLIGAEILSLSEADVPPEDVVFHKFYTNKMNCVKKSKKKKKKKDAGDEAAEDLYAVDGEDDESDLEEIDTMKDDESDNEEIDTTKDSTDLTLDNEDEYDYDDLDKVVDEDDELIENASEEDDIIMPSEFSDGELEGDEDGSNIAHEEDDKKKAGNKRKRKVSKHVGASPFASLEDYEHLMNEAAADPETNVPSKKKRHKTKKKPNLMNEAAADPETNVPSKKKRHKTKKKPSSKA